MKQTIILIISGLLILTGSCSVNVNTGNLNIIPLEEKIIEQVAPVSDYTNYWDAIQHFDFDYINRHDVSDEERNFVHGLELTMEGNYEDAEELFSILFHHSNDSLFKKNTGDVLQRLMTYQSDWAGMIRIDSLLPAGLDDQNTISFVRAFQNAEKESYHFPEKDIVLPGKLSMSGVPMIEVFVNGKQQTFWIDTGAEMTVLSSDIAKDCGVENLSDEPTILGTATKHTVNSSPGVIKEFKIGDLLIENHPVIILDKKDLEFKLFKVIRLLKIDGIVGWNAIRNLSMEIDYQNGQTIIRKPTSHSVDQRNFHYICVPFLSMTDTTGMPFKMFIDTGANSTKFFEPALFKVDTTEISHNHAIVGGAGGAQKIRQIVLPATSLILGNHRLDFKRMDVYGDGKQDFFYFDGVVGSDIAKSGTLILDFQNGSCDLKLPAKE